MEWIEELLSERSLREAGLFDAASARRLWEKCQRAGEGGALSNGDNMALVGVLSAQVLHQRFVAGGPRLSPGADARPIELASAGQVQP